MLKCADPIEMPHFVASQSGLHKFAYVPFCGYPIKSGSKPHILWTFFKNTHFALSTDHNGPRTEKKHIKMLSVDPEENAPGAL